ncbi:MAG: hypothetical protein ACR2N4_09485 [Jatrophihabitans sp.]
MTSIRIPARFNGPPDSANGGVVAGLLAALVDTDGPVQVSLRRPPPLETDLRIESVESVSGQLRACDGSDLIAVAEPAAGDIAPVPPVDYRLAVAAASRYEGFTEHPFPTCVGCGVQRPDGLGCHAGPVDPGDPTRVATPFVVREDLPRELWLSWAALDCAGGWAIGLAGRRAVLGRMTALITEVPPVGERCVVVAQGDGWDGRKAFSRSTGYRADGRVFGVAKATWIELR